MANGQDCDTITRDDLVKCLRSLREWLDMVEYAVANSECAKFPRMPDPNGRPAVVRCPKPDPAACG
jgi:hypothetical protein